MKKIKNATKPSKPAFYAWVATGRSLYVWRGAKNKLYWYVKAGNNEKTVDNKQGYNNMADMLDEIHHLWPHVPLQSPTAGPI